MMGATGKLVTGSGCTDIIASRATKYESCVYGKMKALTNCIGFIDGTVIKIARPKGNRRQRVCYNGHERSHALKFQAVTTPDGLFVHSAGPIEGQRHDWTLYIRSGLDEILPSVLDLQETRYCIFGDSG